MIFMDLKIKNQFGVIISIKLLVNSKMGLNLSRGCLQNITQAIE